MNMTQTTPRVALSNTATLVGKLEKEPNGIRYINAFLGIPFAQPPVGELRFQPPRPVKLWKGERKATKYGSI